MDYTPRLFVPGYPSDLHFTVKLAFWDAQHLCHKPSVLPKQNNFSLLPILEECHTSIPDGARRLSVTTLF
jgi:hypothetical protein